MIKLGEFGKYIFGAEFIVGFSVGISFYWELKAAILELGIIRIIVDWDYDASKFLD